MGCSIPPASLDFAGLEDAGRTLGQEDGHRVVVRLGEKLGGRRAMTSLAHSVHAVPLPLGRSRPDVPGGREQARVLRRLRVTGDGARGDEARPVRSVTERQSAQQRSVPGVA